MWGALGAGATLITKQLSGLGYDKAYIHALVMTTNYIPLHNVQSPDMAAKAIQTALNKPRILQGYKTETQRKNFANIRYGFVNRTRMYDKARHTQHFYTTTRYRLWVVRKKLPKPCNSPYRNRPKWIKAQCTSMSALFTPLLR